MQFLSVERSSVMIGTTEFYDCKEKSYGDYCRLVIGISSNYWRDYWDNIGGMVDYCIIEK